MKNIKRAMVIFLAIILVFNTFVFFASPAKAQIAVTDIANTKVSILQHILLGLQHASQLVGLSSMGLPGTGAAVNSAVGAAMTGCQISAKANKIISTADNVGGVSIIAGDAAEIARLSVKITTLTAISLCYETILTGLRSPAGSALASIGQQGLSAMGYNREELNNLVISYDDRIDALVELRNSAIKKMWEGVAFRILATVQQQITTKIVNGLIAKYKIGNYLKYADAVATQVYTANYVEKTFPDKADQLIVRSLLSSDGIEYDLMPYLHDKADKALGFLPDQLAFSDPDYYVKLARASTGETNPYFMRMIYEEKAGATRAEAAAMAQAEIAQGQGFIPARNCSGVISQQNARLDGQRQQLGKNLAVSSAAYNKLRAQDNVKPGSVSEADFKAAADALEQSNIAYADLGKSADFFAKACADIKNPAAAISNFTNSYLASTLNVVNAPKPGNLPFFANFVEGVATNFLTGIINGSSPSTQLLTDVGYQTANIAANELLQGVSEHAILKDADKAAQLASSVFSAANSSVAGQYVVTWNVQAVPGADHIAITTTGLNYTERSTSGQITIRATGGITLTLKVYDAANKLLASPAFTLPISQTPTLNLPSSGGNLNDAISVISSTKDALEASGELPVVQNVCGANGVDLNGNQCNPGFNNTNDDDGEVNGAFTQTPLLNIRGPLPQFHPRGE